MNRIIILRYFSLIMRLQMRKLLIVLSLILVFGILSAEETVKNQDEVKQPETPVAEKTAESEKRAVFVTPTVGFGGGWPLWMTVNAGVDISFTTTVPNFQVGLDLAFRVNPTLKGEYGHATFFLPVKAKLRYDFPVQNPHLKFVGLWAAAGLNVIMAVPNKDAEMFMDIGHRQSDSEYYTFLRFTWGLATDLVFKNNMVLRLGFYDALPIEFLPLHFNAEIGYRF